MLAKRIIPCLDVRAGQVVKGVGFQDHRVVGDILALAAFYEQEQADELVFYDITASSESRTVTVQWVNRVAALLSIPFTVAGGIRSVQSAGEILRAGADKISINSPALANPAFINQLSDRFGRQCVVVGVDSRWVLDDYYVFQYTGDIMRCRNTGRKTTDWVMEASARGAGEIVLNCMQQDGRRQGFDLQQLKIMRERTALPLIASGGAGRQDDFAAVFNETQVEGALAAGVFHDRQLRINTVKRFLHTQQIKVRL